MRYGRDSLLTAPQVFRADTIDEVALRDRDTDANGSLDERIWYLQNWRYDVVALVADSGDQREMVRYNAYGVPFGLPGGDADSDGDCDDGDTVDTDLIQDWVNAPSYDLRADVDLDGDLASEDISAALTGTTLGRENLSNIGNALGLAGRPWAYASYNVRHRRLQASVGRWLGRDPIGYVDGSNLMEYSRSSPLAATDPFGLLTRREQNVTEPLSVGDCGAFTWFTELVLSPPETGPRMRDVCPWTKGHGAIIQFVTISDGWHPCANGLSPIPGSPIQYWEVLGTTLKDPLIRSEDGLLSGVYGNIVNDTIAGAYRQNTRGGTGDWTGHAKVKCMLPPAIHLLLNNFDEEVPEAGELPATTDSALGDFFFGDDNYRTAPGQENSTTVEWSWSDCCDPNTSKTKVTGSFN